MLDIWTINIVQFINKMFCRITVNLYDLYDLYDLLHNALI